MDEKPSQPGYSKPLHGTFLKTAIEPASHNLTVWLQNVDDTFIIWSHGEAELMRFLDHLNNIHPNIQFTIEKEIKEMPQFLDIMIIHKANLPLGHKVYRKPTHTDLYLYTISNHHP